MADRELPDLKSRVRIDTDDLDRANRKAKDLGDTVRKQGDATEPLQRGLRVSQQDMEKFGSSMSRNVTLPLVAGAAVALKMGSDFETTFTQMQGLAGVTAGEVDGLRQSVLDLASETARSPQDVAEGLYFIRSAGLEGATALEALDASAKAAAVGLGETQDVADAVTSAMNSYGPEALSAAQATDTLVAAVREGKGEAAAMAPQLGRLLPIATELGVEFGEVAGGLAFLTRGNGDAAQSATQLNGVLQKILRPTEQAKDALANAGLSADQLRATVREDGLIAALQLLEGRMGTNSDAFKQVFDDTEGLTGALALLRGEGVEAAAVIDSVTNSSGDLREAFDTLSETDAFKQQQALADLKATAIETSAQMAPALTNIASGVGDVVSTFLLLPDVAQTALLVFGGLVAAAGPVVNSAIAIKKAYTGVSAALSGASLTGAGAVFAAAAVGLGLLTGAFISAKQEAARAQAAIDDIVDAAQAAGKTADEIFGEKLARTFAGFDDGLSGAGVQKAVSALRELGFSVTEIAAGMTGSTEEFQEFRKQAALLAYEGGDDITYLGDLEEGLGSMRKTANETERQQRDLIAAQDELAASTEDGADKAFTFAGSHDALAGAAERAREEASREQKSMEDLAKAYQDAEDRLNSLTDSVLAGFDADLNYEDALRDFAGAQDAVTLAEEDIRINGWTLERQMALDQANRDLEQSALDLSQAELNRADAHAEATGATIDATDRNNLLVGSLLRMAAELDPNSPLRQRLADVIADLREVAGEHDIILKLTVDVPDATLDPDNPFFGNFAGFGGSSPLDRRLPTLSGGKGLPIPDLPGGPTMPRLPKGGSSGPVNLNIYGQPDAATITKLEQVAQRIADQSMTGLYDTMVRAR